MGISTYQINNVLRVYGNQLRQGRFAGQTSSENKRSPDMVTITAGSKRDAVIEKVSTDMLERIGQNGPQSQDEKNAFQKLQDDYGQRLIMSQKNGNEFEFKAIDETGSTVSDIPVATSDNLLEKLQAHIRATVSQNMI
jgi:hypothetical protein